MHIDFKKVYFINQLSFITVLLFNDCFDFHIKNILFRNIILYSAEKCLKFAFYLAFILNKGLNLKFTEDHSDQQPPEEGWNLVIKKKKNLKNEDISSNVNSNKSSQKFKQKKKSYFISLQFSFGWSGQTKNINCKKVLSPTKKEFFFYFFFFILIFDRSEFGKWVRRGTF